MSSFGSCRSRRVSTTLSCLALALGAAAACTSSGPARPNPTGGAAGTSSQAGVAGSGAGTAGASAGTAGSGTAGTGAGTAGTGAGTAGTNGAAGTGAGTAGSGTSGSSGGAAGSSPDASTPMDAAAGSSGTDSGSIPFDAAGRTPPTCKTPVPSPIPAMKPTSECDFLLQSLDFEDMFSYVSPQIEITNYGTVLGAYEINKCMPYCYAKELTIGVDIVGGGDQTGLQGEVIVHFPATGPELPIATAIGRDSLAWIQLSGATAPPFTIMAQMVVESSTAGIIPAKDMHKVGYNAWLDYQGAEFKYFGISAGNPFMVDPVNITGIGFRIFAPTGLPKGMEWHGLLIIDHMEIRKGGEDMPTGAGNYPYGLN